MKHSIIFGSALSMIIIASGAGCATPLDGDGAAIGEVASSLSARNAHARTLLLERARSVLAQHARHSGGTLLVNTSYGYGFGGAEFSRGPRPSKGPRVAVGNGECSILTCTVPGTCSAGVGDHVSAGNVSVTGTSTALTFTPDAANLYADQFVAGSLWNGGERVRVRASGASGGVRAFSLAARAPVGVLVTAPMSNLTTLRVSDGLSLSWTAPTGDWQQHATVAAYLAYPNGDRMVACEFPPGDGAAAIPSSVLAHLGVGVPINLSIVSSSHAETFPLPDDIELTLNSVADQSGQPFSAQFQLE